MNDFQREIYKTIDILTEQKLRSLGFDRTKRGRVVSINGVECVVQIDGENYTCKLRRGIYVEPNDIVFVKFPQNSSVDKYVETILGGNETPENLVMSAEEILQKLKTVDGHGSGLDADTLDGKHGSEYATKEDLNGIDVDISGETIVENINLSTAIIDDKNLSASIKDKYTKSETDVKLDIKVDKVAGKQLSTEDFTTIEKTKLTGIEDGAEKNKVNSVNSKIGDVVISKSDIGLSNIENKSSATIRGEITNTNITNALGYTPENSSNKGVANGYASLDSNIKIPLSMLPDIAKQQTYVVATIGDRDILNSLIMGEKCYITGTGNSYIWDGIKWVTLAKADWENVNLQWTNIVGKPQSNIADIDDATAKRHIHSNKAIIDTITQILIDRWNSAWTHISDTVKHITTAERTKWNAVDNKADTTYVNSELSKKTNTGHTHTESDITNLDKYTKAETDTKLNGKVDKVTGKQLSTEDFTAIYKSKLDGVESGANKYTHPNTHSLSMITETTDRKILTASERNKIAEIDSKVDKISGKGLSDENYTLAEKNKLAGIAIGATKNDTDANLKNRANHTGTQPSSTISDFASTVRNTVLTGLSTATNAAITATDTVLSALGKLQKQISDNLSTLTNHIANKSNPHGTTKSHVGLGNVDNTADSTKNVLSATKLTTVRTINEVSFDGTSNIIIEDSTKEPKFTKNTAFNKNFGTTAGTVAQGNDVRLSDARTPLAHNHNTLYNTKTEVSGLLDDKADKTQVLTNVPVNAKFTDTVYTHPSSHPASIITESITKRFVSDTEKSTWNAKASTSVATTSADGLMANTDKAKLDGVQAGAQVNTVTSVAGKTGAVTVTKGDVALGSVLNYGLSTQSEAETGTSNAKYMTPLRTKQAIDKQVADKNYVTQDELGDAGFGDMVKSIYDTNNNGIVDNAEKVNGFTVEANVPSNAVFTDTKYTHPSTHPYSMITGAPTSLPANGGSADKSLALIVEDTRNTDPNPSYYPSRSVVADFKANAQISPPPPVTTGSSYSHIMTMNGWTGGGAGGGGETTQLAFGDSVAVRVSNGTTTWKEWNRMVSESDLNEKVKTNVPANAKFTDTVYIHPGSGTNPHATTKADVGLGSVQNYGIATQSEAEMGARNAKYMTPLRVKQAIDSSPVYHVGKTDTPNKNLLWINTNL